MRLRAHGVGVEVPSGWEARIARREPERPAPGEVPRSVLHAATVALPEDRGDFGGGVTGRLGPEDVFLSLFEYGPEAVTAPLFAARGRPRPTAADFSPSGLQRSIPGQSGKQWFFQEAGRAFCLYVVLGSHARRAAQVPAVRSIIDALDLERAVPR